MSRPSLWAPSSVILGSTLSGLSANTFLRYVEEREIRIFARYNWLHEPAWRNSLPWSEAAWNEDIDGVIKRICCEDANEPKDDRRVVVVPEEQSHNFVETYVQNNPKEVQRWKDILLDEEKRKTIPRGTREAAWRDIDQPDLAIRRIIRDAYNHGQAISYSGADAPLLAKGINPKFLRILAEAPPLIDKTISGNNPGRQLPITAPTRANLQLSNIAEQLMTILGALDTHARDRGDLDSLDRFIRGEGRRGLMSWIGRIHSLLRRTQGRELNGLVLEELRSDLAEGKFSSAWRDLWRHWDEASVFATASATALIGFAAAPLAIIPFIGVAAAAYPVGKGAVRQLGYLPATFSGPQWPFLYAYGTSSKRPQLKQLHYVLDELQRKESTESADI